jgi:hypothetical protein
MFFRSGINLRFFSCRPDSALLPSLHKPPMNRRWTPSARRNAFNYPPRFLQARNVALYVSCVQFVLLVRQPIFFRLPLSDQILNLRQQRPLSKTIFLTHNSHKEKRAQRDMKTLAPNRTDSWLRDQFGCIFQRAGVLRNARANAKNHGIYENREAHSVQGVLFLFTKMPRILHDSTWTSERRKKQKTLARRKGIASSRVKQNLLAVSLIAVLSISLGQRRRSRWGGFTWPLACDFSSESNGANTANSIVRSRDTD